MVQNLTVVVLPTLSGRSSASEPEKKVCHLNKNRMSCISFLLFEQNEKSNIIKWRRVARKQGQVTRNMSKLQCRL
jgi:hypothetical protein